MESTRPALCLRKLTSADLAFADSIRALAGWNQTLADWERFLATDPDGCFLAEWRGTPAGTATTTIYGAQLAWIGMVLVHPDFRRRGIGRALLQHAIAYLHNRGVRCIKLDATPEGKLVYDALGFRTEWTLKRWAGRPGAAKRATPAPELRAWRPADAAFVEPLDTAAFGVWRRSLWVTLGSAGGVGLVTESKNGGLAGLGFVRPGSQALHLGPVIANSPEVGLDLIEGLMVRAMEARNPGDTIFWDIPDPNERAVSWAQGHVLSVQRPLIRMFLGENATLGDPRRQFAIGGPEVG
ncbi:MAG TPA: GNAT family N-acetyltransferase [Verrucomicrobiae bacterium]|nr:GNAT family N-acetyltransferase [Verrucomicrobiae bacterium]